MRLLRRWADTSAQREIDRLTETLARRDEELAGEKSRVRVQQLELDELAAVIARNIKRVEAETAAAARQIAANQE